MPVGTWIAAALLLDRYGARQPIPDGTWDAIIVAGCKVHADGRPCLALRRRVERAVQLWRAGLAPKVLFTGGPSATAHTEAEVAARYARALGLPDEAVALETRSNTTLQNARFAAAALAAHSDRFSGTARVIVVTDTYHVLRTRWIFSRCFPRVAVVASDLPFGVRLPSSLREVVALVHFALRGQFL